MKPKIELPPKYYLSHFTEFKNHLVELYGAFFEEKHVRFLTLFDSLPEDAQCLYVRLMNRKGKYFMKASLRYQEITSFEEALKELMEKEFIRTPAHEDQRDIFDFLPKQKLLELAYKRNLSMKKSWAREKIVEELSRYSFLEELTQDIIVQLRIDELSYLLFLYFGSIQENLSLYTLRDLGIRSVSERTIFKPRFSDRNEALSHFFYALMSEGTRIIPPLEEWPEPLSPETAALRERLLLSYAEEFADEEKLHILKHATAHPGREKYSRLLFQLGRKEEALAELEKILDKPFSDEELLFAEDFLARKFGKKRTSILTDALREAREIAVDESYYRHPEEGVIHYFLAKGAEAHHLENYLWNSLFGLVFWDEIHDSEKSSLFNPFERFPADLKSSRFYEIHKESIHRKLESLTLESVLRKYEEKNGTVNAIFGWHESIPMNLELLFRAPLSSISSMLLHMTMDYENRSSGFPDLMVVEEGTVKFFEIKAPGDSLKGKQLLQIQALKKSGFPVEVLKVTYAYNPDQTYVVVDLETTGGMIPYHRITEIGAVKVKNGEIVDRFQTLVNPGRNISREIQELTGITNDMVKMAPKFEEVAAAFQEFSKDAIFVAHNVNFDYSFLQYEYERLEQKFVRPFICTKVGMRKHYPGLESYGLKNLTKHFGISLVTHHRALCDAEAAMGLLLLINQARAQKEADNSEEAFERSSASVTK